MAEQYVVSFSISQPSSQGLPLLNEAREVVLEWFRDRFRGTIPEQSPGEAIVGDERLELRAEQLDEAGYWSLEWEHPDRDDDSYRWRTAVRLATRGGPVLAHIDVGLLAGGPQLRLEGKDVDRPALVPMLVSAFDCDCQAHPLSVKAYYPTGEAAVTFTNDVILSPERRLPVVVVTQDSAGAYPIMPDRLQSKLAGLATRRRL